MQVQACPSIDDISLVVCVQLAVDAVASAFAMCLGFASSSLQAICHTAHLCTASHSPKHRPLVCRLPAFPVDTHIHRLAQRWGLTSGTNVEQTEADLKAVFAEEHWNKLHVQVGMSDYLTDSSLPHTSCCRNLAAAHTYFQTAHCHKRMLRDFVRSCHLCADHLLRARALCSAST